MRAAIDRVGARNRRGLTAFRLVSDFLERDHPKERDIADVVAGLIASGKLVE